MRFQAGRAPALHTSKVDDDLYMICVQGEKNAPDLTLLIPYASSLTRQIVAYKCTNTTENEMALDIL